MAWRSQFIVDDRGVLCLGQAADRHMVDDRTKIVRVLDAIAGSQRRG